LCKIGSTTDLDPVSQVKKYFAAEFLVGKVGVQQEPQKMCQIYVVPCDQEEWIETSKNGPRRTAGVVSDGVQVARRKGLLLSVLEPVK
jgi:hypothetical protein